MTARARAALGRLALAFAVLLGLGNAAWSARDQGWTYDEPLHLGWAERFLDTGEAERASQERFNSKTTIMLPNVLLQRAAAALGAADEDTLKLAARLPNVLWLAVLLAVVFALTRRAFGRPAALLAATACALDPNLVAHASVATSDVPYALATVAALAAGLALARRPSAAKGAALGLALGFAFVAKVTAVLLLPGLAVLPFVVPRAVADASDARPRPLGSRLAVSLAVAAAVALVVVDAAYLFRGLGAPLGTIGLTSTPLSAAARALPGLRLPVPAAVLTALDASLVAERGEWNTLILGRRYPQGVWFYFAFLWLVKTPVLVLAATAVGLVRTARDAALVRDPWVRLLAWNLVFLLAYFSLVFRAHIGYRYVLMAVPLAYMLAAPGLATLRPAVLLPLAAAAFVVGAAENLLYLGNPLSFTNAAVQPKAMVYRLIADSNVDWGQNRTRIERWLRERRLTYTHLDPVHLLPGHDTIDLNQLAGIWDFERYRWVREHLRPVGHLGHTYLLYEVDDATWRRFLEEDRRRAATALDGELCPDGLDYVRAPTGSKLPFALRDSPPAGQVWAVCVDAPEGLDLDLRVLAGALGAGRFTAPGVCDADLLVAGQEVWWQLDPGRHALCLLPPANRRTWLPYRLEARWLVVGRHAALNARALLPGPTPPPPGATSPRSSSPPRPPGG